jgi:hypothetical protein
VSPAADDARLVEAQPGIEPQQHLQVVRVLVGNSLQNRPHEVRTSLVAVQAHPRAPHGGVVGEQTPVEVRHEQEALGARPNLSCRGRQLVEVGLVDLLARGSKRFPQPT